MRQHEHETEFDHEAAPPVRKRRDTSLTQSALTPGAPPAVQRAALLDLQRAAGNASTGSLIEEDEAAQSVRSVVGSGGGKPLEPETRSFMEERLGADFSDVRVHTDATAASSAKAMSAQAYTVGNDVVFQRDHYAPDTDAGKHVLAHELTHVVQQRSGPVSGTEVGGGVKVSDPSDSFEQAAESTATQVMSAQTATPATTPAAAPSVQREVAPEEEEEELQMSRMGEEEEEELQMSRSVEENEEEAEEDELAPG